MGDDAYYAEQGKEDVAPRLAKQGCRCSLQSDWQEEDERADDLLGGIALFACQLRVHWQCVVVIDSHLEEKRIEHACREE